ncbi:MAG: aldehyde dehydrogenase family protein [Cyclobacteriaceae bacterium]|nr:aldehyde dehydrogenase family protein [Cyclobacteriaceae bacterium HetDA_MAG_MS6]
MELTTTETQIEEVLNRQKRQSIEERTAPISNRIQKLKRLEKWILSNRETIKKEVYLDFYKSGQETDLSEIYVVLTEIREAIRSLKHWAKPTYVGTSFPYLGTSGEIQYEPKGMCLIISPWNYPFNLAVGPLVSALAAGNVVVMKPSEYTPHTSKLIKEMVNALFEEGEVTVFEGDHEVSQKLLRFPFDHMFFTGSPRVGKMVMKAASEHLASVTLELGGKSPVIVDETADLKDTSEKLAWGKWLNAGQTCVAPDYLLVNESRKDELVRRLKVAVQHQYVKKSAYTGIVNEAHYNRLNDWLGDAINKGAKLEFGGEIDPKRRYFGPTVLSELPEDCILMQEEIFGPILPIKVYQNLEEAIDYMNEGMKPLSLYIYSRSKRNINSICKKTSSGTVCINDNTLQFAHPELPFGGVNNSGIGKAHGHHGFMAFSNEKSVLRQRRGLTMAKTLYPPYGRLKNKVIDLLIRFF